jgi:hypothetical protein
VTTVSDWLSVFALLYVGGVFCLCILPFFLYFRVKGIERALWAVVSQLQALRSENKVAASPGISGAAQSDVPAYRHVANSMFGR